jgi:hypothetical protein
MNVGVMKDYKLRDFIASDDWLHFFLKSSFCFYVLAQISACIFGLLFCSAHVPHHS